MLKFKHFILETIAKGAGASADSLGKERELGLGKALNGGQDLSHYRAEGKTPAEMHHIHAEKVHGQDYHNKPSSKKAVEQHTEGAKKIANFIKRKGYGGIKRTVWTSQEADHEKETGVYDPNTTADLISTTDKGHKLAISVKTGKAGTVNYDNPGLGTLSRMSGKDLSVHTKAHQQLTSRLGIGTNHKKYKELRDSSNKEDQAKAKQIKDSSDKMNQAVAKDFHGGLSKMSHSELHHLIRNTIAPPTHLRHIISHQTLDSHGNETGHHVYDLHDHADQYLNHFENLHTGDHKPGATSVTVYGKHKKTGKKMPVARWAIYAGGRPANGSPRGATVLPSEHHKDVHYTDHD